MHASTQKRAIISVSDKTGIVEFAQFLSAQGIAIYSTGGTSALLREHDVTTTEIADYTDFPEIMGGRVKTLHPKIYAGILRREQDLTLLEEFNILPFDFVIVNLYPFAKTIANPQADLDSVIENIDIGGPCMLRAAAKNHQAVTVICDPKDYSMIQAQWQETGKINLTTRQQLMAKAFAHTAAYDALIANHFAKIYATDTYPEQLTLTWNKQQPLRYGENPTQTAAFYADPNSAYTLATAKQYQGKELSYNNIADADAALACVRAFTQPACVIVKHANPCGVAIATTIDAAYTRAFSTDPTSAFGGIIAFNRALDAKTAALILEKQFVEVIIAPMIDNDALAILAQKPNVRVLSLEHTLTIAPSGYSLKKVDGGLLIQQADLINYDPELLRVVTVRHPTEQELQDLLFAWTVAKYVKSNAIVYAKDLMTIGIGAGQMSRVYSAKIASIKANDEHLTVQGSVMASDAFFPFRDGIDAANTAGITAVIQPGGSMRDAEVIAAADEANIAMVFTGLRHFLH